MASMASIHLMREPFGRAPARRLWASPALEQLAEGSAVGSFEDSLPRNTDARLEHHEVKIRLHRHLKTCLLRVAVAAIERLAVASRRLHPVAFPRRAEPGIMVAAASTSREPCVHQHSPTRLPWVGSSRYASRPVHDSAEIICLRATCSWQLSC